MTKDKSRLEKLINYLKQDNIRLKEALCLEPIQIHKDATIFRFKVATDLSWKTMQAALRYLGENAESPREAIRVCARIDIISDPESWITLLNARNLTSHVYDEFEADEVYKSSATLPPLVDTLLTTLTPKLDE